MKLTVTSVCLSILLAASGAAWAQSAPPTQFVEGTHYDVLSTQQPTVTDDDNVEVAEVFAYSCPHCMNFEPALAHWLTTKADYITFTRLPAAYGDPVSDIHAKAYYTAEALGILEQTHEAFFKEFHERRNYLETEDKLREFYSRFDVDADTFTSTFNSFLVASKLNKAQDLMRRYGITETPMIIVNGKYQSRGQQAGNYGTWFAIIDHLAAKENALK